ncbi:MAG: hypothetical protein RR256_02555, partial [Bacteroidales bacterium]
NTNQRAYQWQISTTGLDTSFTNAPFLSTAQNYLYKQNLAQNLWFRRVFTSNGCSSISNIDSVYLIQNVDAGILDADSTACYEGRAEMRLYKYVGNRITWQISSDQNQWTTLPGQNCDTLVSSPLTTNTYFRAIVGQAPCGYDTTQAALVRIGQPKQLSIRIHTATDTLCQNTLTTFTSEVQFAGRRPNYQWLRNGKAIKGATSDTYVTDSLHHHDTITCQLSVSDLCVSDSVRISDSIVMYVHAITMEVMKDTTICNGESIDLWVKGSQTQIWSEGSTKAKVRVTPSDTTQYSVIATDAHHCTIYDTITITPAPLIQIYSPDTICAFTQLDLKADDIAGLTYQWSSSDPSLLPGKSNTATASPSKTSTYTLRASIGACTVKVSKEVIVQDLITPVIDIRYEGRPGYLNTVDLYACDKAEYYFRATAKNGGNQDIYWMVNGVKQAVVADSFSSKALQDKDIVNAYFESTLACRLYQTATSTQYTIKLTPLLDPSIRIEMNKHKDSICEGDTLTFQPIYSCGTGTPSFVWKNASNHRTLGTDTIYRGPVFNGDTIYCMMKSADSCVSTLVNISNSLAIKTTAIAYPTLTATIEPSAAFCAGIDLAFYAQAKDAGNNPQFRWYKDSVLVSSNSGFIYFADATSNLDGKSFVANGLNPQDYAMRCELISDHFCVSPARIIYFDTLVTARPMVSPSIQLTTQPASVLCNTLRTQVPLFVGDTLSVMNDSLWTRSTDSLARSSGWTLANSLQQINDQGSIGITIQQLKGHQIFGLGQEFISTPTQIAYAYVLDTAMLSIQENGTLIQQLGRYQIGDKLNIEVADHTVRYLRNDSILYTSAVAVNRYPLLVYAALHDSNASLAQVLMEYRSTGLNFIASPMYAGSDPHYQWYLNGQMFNNDSAYFPAQYRLFQTGDRIQVRLQSNDACAIQDTALSNEIVLTQGSGTDHYLPELSSACYGDSVTLRANGGGSYRWSGLPQGKESTAASCTIHTLHNRYVRLDIISPQACHYFSRHLVEILPLPISKVGADYSVCQGDPIFLTANQGRNPQSQQFEWTSSDHKFTESYTDDSLSFYPVHFTHLLKSIYQNDTLRTTNTNGVWAASATTLERVFGDGTLRAQIADPSSSFVFALTDETKVSSIDPDQNTFSIRVQGGKAHLYNQGVMNVKTQRNVSAGSQLTIEVKDSLVNYYINDEKVHTHPYTYNTVLQGDISMLTQGTATLKAVELNVEGVYFMADTTREYYLRSKAKNACYTYDTLKIEVITKGSLNLIPSDTNICYYASVVLQDTSIRAGNSYTWTPSRGLSNINNPVGQAIFTGDSVGVHTYILELKDANGCYSVDTAHITVNKLETPTLFLSRNPQGSICQSDSILFTATGDYLGKKPSYTWIKNDKVIVGAPDTNMYVMGGFVDGDRIKCKVRSNADTCLLTSTATSKEELISVLNDDVNTVSIADAQGHTDTIHFCPEKAYIEISSIYSMDGIDGAPLYKWYLNDIQQPIITKKLLYSTPTNGDSIYLTIEGSLSCSRPRIARSNTIHIVTHAPIEIDAYQDQSIHYGDTLFLQALIANPEIDSTYTYQWRGNNMLAPTNTNSLRAVPDGTETYYVDVISAYGCQATDQATVTVDVNPYISLHPESYTLCENDTAHFSIQAKGPDLTYQWMVKYPNGTSEALKASKQIPTVTNDTLHIQGIEVNMDGNHYYCIVNGRVGTTPDTSNEGTLHVNTRAILRLDLEVISSEAICLGTYDTLTAKTQNAGSTPIYQWYVNEIAQVEQNTDQFISNTLHNADSIRCVVISSLKCIYANTDTAQVKVIRWDAPLNHLNQSGLIYKDYNTEHTATSTTTGGKAPYTHQWISSPQNRINGRADTCNMTTVKLQSKTQFYYTTTDQNGCTDLDTLDILIRGGEFEVQANAKPDTLCAGSGTFLSVVISGGDMSKTTVKWTSIPNDPSLASNATNKERPFFVKPSQNTQYIVEVKDGLHTTVYDTLQVVVQKFETLTATLDARIHTVCVGDTLEFAVQVKGALATPKYQWMKNALPILRATDSVLRYTDAQTGDQIYCQLSSNYRCATVSVVNTDTQAVKVGTRPDLSLSANP